MKRKFFLFVCLVLGSLTACGNNVPQEATVFDNSDVVSNDTDEFVVYDNINVSGTYNSYFLENRSVSGKTLFISKDNPDCFISVEKIKVDPKELVNGGDETKDIVQNIFARVLNVDDTKEITKNLSYDFYGYETEDMIYRSRILTVTHDEITLQYCQIPKNIGNDIRESVESCFNEMQFNGIKNTVDEYAEQLKQEKQEEEKKNKKIQEAKKKKKLEEKRKKAEKAKVEKNKEENEENVSKKDMENEGKRDKKKKENKNPLLEAEIEEYDNYACITLSKDEIKSITEEDYKEFLEIVQEYAEKEYNWFSILFGDGTGITFPGCMTYVANYGKVDDEGALLEYIGVIMLDGEHYIYSEEE